MFKAMSRLAVSRLAFKKHDHTFERICLNFQKMYIVLKKTYINPAKALHSIADD